MKKPTFPKCDRHRSCFANKEGWCICLKDNDFGDKDCPFYKNRRNVDMKAIEELEDE